MRISYITIEDIASGLFRTQVFEVAKAVVELNDDIEVDLVVINRPWKFLSHRRVISSLRSLVPADRMRVRYLPLLPPLRGVVGSAFGSIIVFFYLCATLSVLSSKRNDLYHARGYWVCLALILSGRQRILFDPRSIWPLENISIGNIVRDSLAHRLWMAVERVCLAKSRSVAGVSDGMVKYYENICPSARVRCIPISFSHFLFRYDVIVRNEMRMSHGLADKIVFGYSGSLGMSRLGFGAIVTMVKFLATVENCFFIFLVPDTEGDLVSLLDISGIRQQKNFIVHHPRHGDIFKWLSACDFGFHALPVQDDSFSRLGTKVVEYWACGLPVLINENVGAAKDFVKENGYGGVISEDMNLEAVKSMIRNLSQVDRSRIANYAIQRFATSSIASSYIEEYKRM